ncbi:MAG: tRNA (adenosine(37)-N6)-dimethylallyltransferase MiaA [Woeseiaceae bacterium]
MGPTASCKTEFAISLCKRFPCDVISVDSALVYRGMDVGTAKPDSETLARVPHHLVDIREPEQSYSAGEFVRDARAEIRKILNEGRIPLLVGGTMLYFRALSEGIADLPPADPEVRREIDERAGRFGWPDLHRELSDVDPQAAARISPHDSQRIQRALEVYRVSGKCLSDWQSEAGEPESDIDYIKIGLKIEPRKVLHERIARRLADMIEGGFIEELKELRKRPGLTQDSPSMRSVGYRQFWQYLEGHSTFDDAADKALYATRQLAKRQFTWLRSEKSVFAINPLEAGAIDAISAYLKEKLKS